jgi:sterol desaturase/sphingolipid hydroxylase (fatty acid hydroxylase superfamily)
MVEVLEWFSRILLSDSVLMTLLVVPALLVLERVRPVHKTPWAHYLFGVTYWICNLLLLAVVGPLLASWLAVGVQALGFGLIDLRSFGIEGIWGAVLALLVVTFITDFFFYWFHRTLHGNKVLWQAHLLHHSDELMTVMTANRGHVAETILSPLFIALPMAVLFELPPVTIGILSVVPYAYQFFAHANLNVGFGPLWWLLISPNYHRIHHSIEPRHHDKNFTNWFPIWDILFGTLYLPAKDELPATGVEGVHVRTIPEAFLLPFAGWWAMFQKSRKQGSRAS